MLPTRSWLHRTGCIPRLTRHIHEWLNLVATLTEKIWISWRKSRHICLYIEKIVSVAVSSFLTTHFFTISLPPAYDSPIHMRHLAYLYTIIEPSFSKFSFLSCTFSWYRQISMEMLENVRVISEWYHWQNTKRLVLTFRWQCCMTLEEFHFVWSFILHDYWIHATGYKLWKIWAVNGNNFPHVPGIVSSAEQEHVPNRCSRGLRAKFDLIMKRQVWFDHHVLQSILLISDTADTSPPQNNINTLIFIRESP